MANRSPHVQGSTADEKYQDITDGVQARFMPFEKPFDGDKPSLHASRPNTISSWLVCRVVLPPPHNPIAAPPPAPHKEDHHESYNRSPIEPRHSQDMQNLPDPRSHPKHLDRDLPTSPTKELCPKNAKAKEKEHKSPRSWPRPKKNGKPSKRKRDTHGSPLSPTRSTELTQLERWLDEPVTAGPYHAIHGVVDTKQSYHANKKRA